MHKTKVCFPAPSAKLPVNLVAVYSTLSFDLQGLLHMCGMHAYIQVHTHAYKISLRIKKITLTVSHIALLHYHFHSILGIFKFPS